jgi:RNA polymerase sigma factor for flagellar operon FliA
MPNEVMVVENPRAHREQLIMEHLPQVRLIARRIHDRLPGNVNLDDLISTGVVGLISAIDRYDESQGVKLRTYAEYKIRGAILDSLRGLDWAPRRQRRRAKQIERALAAVEQRTKTQASENEIAAEIGISVEEYRDWLAEVRGLPLGSLDVASHDGEGRELLRFVADKDEMWPSKILERSQLQEILAQAIERMPVAERTVLSLYYTEELTLREIARVMELHESRISQLKTQALVRLRAFLERKWPNKGALKPVAKES